MIRIKKIIFLLVTHFILLSVASSQNDQRLFNLKNVSPPSPNSASLGKYADWPVDLYTGLIGINIPLCDLQGREGTIPVSISYHASGIKVGEVSSNVGLGWALNAGGVITRSVKGFPDEEPAGYFDTRQLFNNPGDLSQGMITPSEDEQVQLDVASGARELEPDYYMFNALGRSFTLFFDGTGNIITQPYSKIKFTTDFVNKTWTVILEDGTKLKFGGSEDFVERNICSCFGESSANYISSWMLKSVTYPNGEEITFTYVQTGFKQDMGLIEKMANTAYTVFKDMDVIAKNISVIESDLGKIEFIYNPSARQDLSGGNALSAIKVFSKATNQYISQYNFIQTYSQAVTGNYYSNNLSYYNYRLRLLSIEQVLPSNTNIKNQVWQFQYNSLNLPHRHSYAQDHWGYYNGVTTNTTMLPQAGPFYPPAYNVADKSANGTYMQAEMLTKIIYPTGGSSQFEFEPNGYADQAGYHFVGGLRIKSTTDINEADPAKNIKKNYIYEDAYVLHDFQPDDYLSSFTEKIYDCGHTPPVLIASNDWIMRSTASKSALGIIKGGNVGYGKVTTQLGDNAANGKIVSEFLNVNDLDADAAKVFPYPSATSRDWRRGQLLTESVYTNTGTTPIKKTVNTYDFILKGNITTYKAGFKVISSSGCLPYQYISNIIDRRYYNIITEQVKPLSATEYIYDNNGAQLTKATNYYYDNPDNLSPTRIETTDSKGNTVKVINRTPLEKVEINTATPLTGTASAAIETMLARNIISPVLQKEEYANSVLQSRTLTNYKNWTPAILQPDNIQAQIKNNPIEARVLFNKYDAYGNLQEQQKPGSVKECYIYGYNNQYLVAKIVGSDYITAASFANMSILNNSATNDQQMRAELNKIRTGLAGTVAQVTTYTYKPLIGISSETDPNGRTITYEYDGFNRLILLRDKDNKVIKRVCYNYAGQIESCPYYNNTVQSGTFTRNNCGSGYTGSSVIYTVPANTYGSGLSQADADAQAMADVTANGQAYANANGTCTPGCTFAMNPGYTTVTNSITNNGATASFYMVFYSSSTMQPNTNYTIATINGSCRPSVTRTITTTIGGRTWLITIVPTGQMTWKITSGTALAANTTVASTTLSYNL